MSDPSTFPKVEDPGLCENEGCTKPTTQQCARCKVRIYCCRECQVTAWQAYHKEECANLKACKRASQVATTFAIIQDSATSMGIVSTKDHGSHFYVMEQFQTFGNESNRRVVLATTEDLSLKGIMACVVDAILFPEFDGDQGGRRRPYYAEIFKDTFPDPKIVDAICTLLLRLGVTIKSLGENDISEGYVWDTSWFLVHKGWPEEITDKLFLGLIDSSRLKPLPPNGMARKALASLVAAQKAAPRLDPADYPPRKKVLKLPYSTPEECLLVVCKDGELGTIWQAGVRGNRILVRQKVQLQARTGRPYHDDVILVIYKALMLVKKRPERVMVGQPSVCALSDVGPYEKSLDDSICKGSMILAARDAAEKFWNDLISSRRSKRGEG